jgi:hypothetical protein
MAPVWRHSTFCRGFYFVPNHRFREPFLRERILRLSRVYQVEIVRHLPVADLAMPTRAEIERGEDNGLAGNQYYQDLRGATWDEVAGILTREAALFERFDAATDLDKEAELFEEERLEEVFPEADLCGLDVGVAGAVMALSAMGAIPVGSCNAGGFGGHHAASFPYVAFFLARDLADEVLATAVEADVGLDIVGGGIARLFGRTDHDLHRYGQTALVRHGASGEA